MNKKNTYIRKTLIVLYLIITPSFYVFPSYLPAGKRPAGYTGPRRVRQKPRTPVAQPQQPIQAQQQVPAPVAAPITIDQSNQPMEKPDAEPTIASQAMQAKAAASSPGFLMTAYIVLLSTLNKAFGTGIEQSYKPLMQNWKNRQDVLNAKNQASDTARKSVESGEFDNIIIQKATVQAHGMIPGSDQFNEILVKAQNLINLPKEQKIAIETEKTLKKLEPLVKKTSFGSMASEAVYLGLFNTAARLAGGLIGFGATMLLQSLMPTQGQ